MFDTGSSFGGTISSTKTILNENEFNARVSAKNVCGVGRYTVYYHVWCNKELNIVREDDDQFFVRFDTGENEVIRLQVTASPISVEDAREEWDAQTKTLAFQEVRQQGLEKWEKLLSRVEVEGKEEYKRLFYTHLYHIFLSPVRTENRLNEFRATNGEIHKAGDYEHYHGWEIWGNYRNKYSLYSLLVPGITSDIATSLVDLYRYGKARRFMGFYEPVPTVRTEFIIVTLLDIYRRGIRDFDILPAYQRLSAEINNLPRNSADKEIEYRYHLWALGQFAKILGRDDDYELYMEKAHEYKGTWKEVFLPITDKSDVMHADGLYEGTYWQYRWNVPFDIEGIIEMIGGKEKYTEQLEYFFNNHLYTHGNQTDLRVPFMFNYSEKPWLTQKWVNKILTKEMVQYYGTHQKWDTPYVGRIYKDDPEGYIPEMDDDMGGMSSWYVLGAMGFYPVLVGEPVFQLSTPIFEKITIHLDDNREFVIKANGVNDERYYIQGATLNGKEYNKSYINHTDLVSGGTLEYEVSSEPNKEWGGQ